MSLSEDLIKENQITWKSLFTHPFVRELGEGSLPVEKYLFFMKEDYFYLKEYSRVLAIASAKAPDKDLQTFFAEFLHSTMTFEMELHRRTCESLGISRNDLEMHQPTVLTLSYTNFLIKTAYEGDIVEILASLFPCEYSYWEIAKKLKESGLPEKEIYRDWILTYSSEEFGGLARKLKSFLDRFSDSVSGKKFSRLNEVFRESLRFELYFWENAYREGLIKDLFEKR